MEKVFRNSLFGYSKKSVVTYVADMNEDFSKKLMEKDLECTSAVQELREQLEQLRQENEQLRQESEQLRAGRQEVACALIDAKSFAAELKERAQEEDSAMRAENTARHQAELQRLRALSEHVDDLHGALRAVIEKMDAELSQYRAQCASVQTEYSTVELSPEEPHEARQ